MSTKTGKLAQLSTFSHVELSALALAGLVLFENINAGRLISSVYGIDGSIEFDRTINIINAGYELQDAINSANEDALPGLMQAFAALADGYVTTVDDEPDSEGASS